MFVVLSELENMFISLIYFKPFRQIILLSFYSQEVCVRSCHQSAPRIDIQQHNDHSDNHNFHLITLCCICPFFPSIYFELCPFDNQMYYTIHRNAGMCVCAYMHMKAKIEMTNLYTVALKKFGAFQCLRQGFIKCIFLGCLAGKRGTHEEGMLIHLLNKCSRDQRTEKNRKIFLPSWG